MSVVDIDNFLNRASKLNEKERLHKKEWFQRNQKIEDLVKTRDEHKVLYEKAIRETGEFITDCEKTISKIHEEQSKLIKLAIANESKLCLGRAFRICEEYKKLSDKKYIIRDSQAIALSGNCKSKTSKSYIIKTIGAYVFLKNNNFKCVTNNKKNYYCTPKASTCQHKKLIDLTHVLSISSLNMGQSYLLLKEIIKVENRIVNSGNLKEIQNIFN